MTAPFDWSYGGVLSAAKNALTLYLGDELARRAALRTLTLPAPTDIHIATADNVWTPEMRFPAVILTSPVDRHEASSSNEERVSLDVEAIVVLSSRTLDAGTEEATALSILEYCQAVALVLRTVLPRGQQSTGVCAVQVVGSVQGSKVKHKQTGYWITARKVQLELTVRMPAVTPP